MLSNQEFNAWCERLNLSDPARGLVSRIRSSPPVRRVASASGNVSGQYPSKKMRATVQFESHRNELPAIYDLDDDQEVIEFYDQPGQIKLRYQNGNGRNVNVFHTPDYFVIRTNNAGWEECKEEGKLNELARTNPNRYLRGEDGEWRCPPGELYAEQFNLYYQIRSSKDINWTKIRNRQFLQDYLRAETFSIDVEARRSTIMLVSSEPGITLDDLFHKTAATASRDEIYGLIANNEVFIDLSAVPLVEPNRVRVFPDIETATGLAYVLQEPRHAPTRGINSVEVTFGTKLNWDAKVWTIVNVGETKVSLTGDGDAFFELTLDAFRGLVQDGRIKAISNESSSREHPEVSKRFKAANKEDRAEANRRCDLVRASMRGERIDSIPKRTLSYYVSLYREAEAKYGCGYVGLLPRARERGNRNRKLPEESLALLRTFIEGDYESLKQKTKYAAYVALLRACEQRGVIVPSYKTFSLEIRKRPLYEQTVKRKGRRAAYKHEPFYFELEEKTPRHGDRPFEICHIDHTELDVELVCSSTGHNLGRPWATIMTDAFCRRFLAVYLTFDPPSYRSCMMVLRECARRHSRFPETIVVDGGIEFSSIYFESLLARYECTKKTRPPAKARFGSVCERLFGTTNTQFIHVLQGNTQITRNVRQVTKSVNPKSQAIWTLGDLYARLCEYAYELYDTTLHPALGQSPREAFIDGIARTGTRPYRLIQFSEDLNMLTLPSTPKGTAKVIGNKGVKVNHIYYWCEAFRNPLLENTQVEVRYDPFDAGTAYAFVKNRWEECVSSHHLVFRGRSEREMKLAREELLKGRKRHSQQFTVTARRLADFLDSVESDEKLLGQRLRDRESKEIVKCVNGTLSPEPSAEELVRVGPLERSSFDNALRDERLDGLSDLDGTEIYEDFIENHEGAFSNGD
jgi:putative transposase